MEVVPLERRELLDGSDNPIARIPGQLQAHQEIGSTNFRIDAVDFLAPHGQVLLGVLAQADGGALNPGRIRIISHDKRASQTLVQKNDTHGSTASLTLASLRPGEFTALVTPQGHTKGPYNLIAYLAGDTNGDGDVNKLDLSVIKSLRGVKAGNRRYLIGADVNRDGVINNTDFQLAKRNLGVSTSLRPLSVTVGLDLASDPQGENIATAQTVTVIGQTQPGATIRVDSGIDGTIDQLLSANSQGRYQFQVDANFGLNALEVAATDRFGQVSAAGLIFTRLASPVTNPPVMSPPVTNPPVTNPPVITPPPPVDTQPPAITIASPSQLVTTNANIAITGRVADDASGVKSLVARSDSGSDIAVPFDATSGMFSFTTGLPLDGSADGGHQVQFVAADFAGNVAMPARFAFTLDTRPPTIKVSGPGTGTISRTNVTIAGQVADGLSGVASFTAAIDGGAAKPVAVDASGNFTLTTSLLLDGSADGLHQVQLVAADVAGNKSTPAPFGFTLVTQPPSITIQRPAPNLASRADPTITGRVADALSSVTTLLAQVDSGAWLPVTFDTTGAFQFTPSLPVDGSADGEHTVRFMATNAAGIASPAVPFAFLLDHTIVPDPSKIAPSITDTTTTSQLAATSFLYSGPDAIQLGVAPGTITLDRAAVLRGRVLDHAGNPLAGVTISVLAHPEFGLTYTRADGMLDLAVNGGGSLTIEYAKAGYLPVERQLDVPWQDYAYLPDVAMISLDSQVTTVDLASTQPIQVARGSLESDQDGTRQATLLFPAGEKATMTLPDGTTQTLTTLHVRATEYTVGPNGPAAMPGQLPPTSGYTYAVELSTDEAIKAGASQVNFNQAVPLYVENFLKFPVGMAVPTGYFDRAQGQWIASPNGRVIKVLAETGGVVALDIDGSGKAASPSALAALGITDAERTQLATLYKAGESLWRVPITHFTPWDCNWPIGAPQGAQPPNLNPNDFNDGNQDNPNQECGSIIGVENQTLGETIPIAGTPFSLVYRSDRTTGGSVADRTLTIPLTGGTYSSDLRGISLTVLVAGREFTQNFTPAANLSTTFTWDGVDAYGRPVQGKQLATVYIGYSYDAFYYQPGTQVQSFAVVSSGPLLSVPARREITLLQTIQTSFQSYSPSASGLGGWSLDAQQEYDPVGQVLHGGNGLDRSATSKSDNIITTVAGNGVFTDFHNTGDGGPATQAGLDPTAVTVGPDDSLYVISDEQIRRIATNGIISTIAGNGKAGFSGDGGPALQAGMSPVALAFGPDGSLYIADDDGHTNERIRRIAPDGIISTVAGNGISTPDGSLGDGGPATQASFFGLSSIAVARDGTLYIADSGDHRVRRVGTDGIITTVAGDGQDGVRGIGGPANKAEVGDPSSIALGPDGSLYIADGRGFLDGSEHDRILRVGNDGVITTVAGNGQVGSYSGDGGQATSARIPEPSSLTVGADGSLYIALSFTNYRVLRVGSDGVITTLAGNGIFSSSGDHGPATAAGINATSVAVGHDGSLYVVDNGAIGVNGSVRRVSPVLPGLSVNDIIIPSQDGSQLYRFDSSGRHLQTADALTGALIYAFGYDGAGHLSTITDGDGNITSIVRDGRGTPTAIVGPYGQRTSLTVNAQGYLGSVANPANETTTLGYAAGGLLTSMTDPLRNTSVMAYDTAGRLIRDQNAAFGVTTLARTELGGGSYKVTTTNGVGGTRQYLVEQLPDGSKRRTFIDGRGFATVTLESTNGTTLTTAPDGTKTTVVLGPDPRFGMLAPVVTSQIVATPAGLTSTVTDSRTATFGSIGNGSVSLTKLADTVSTNGNVSTSTFDGKNRTITVTTAAGRTSVTTLDAKGRVIIVQVPGVVATGFSYDTRGRLASVTQGNRTVTYSYDTHGDLAQITDPLGRSVTFAYDTADRLVRQTRPDHSVISFSYDASGNMVGLTPPGTAEHSFGYDAANRLTAVIPPTTGQDDTTRYTYNLAGQVVQETLPGGTSVLYAYCECGRLTSITTPLGTYGYTYSDTTGVLTSLSSLGGSQLAYGYDGALLTSLTLTGPVGGSVSWTYDTNFRVTSESVNGGNKVSYGYDKDGLLTQAGSLTLTRDAATGFLTGTTLGTVTDTLAYNNYGEARVYQASIGQSVAFEDDFTRDALGRISRKDETIGGVTTTTDYGYDLNDRLVTVSENGVLTQTYAYDANGNRLSLATTTSTVTGSYDAQDRLLTYGTKTYSYTPAGHLLQVTDTATGESTHYTYDVFGNLTRVDLPTGHTVEYLTDGQDRRIGNKIDGVVTEGLIYSGQLQPVAKTDGAGNIVERFVYGTGVNVPEYMVKGGVTYRFITDQLGSVRLVINTATGQIAQRLDYDPYGRILLDSNPGFQPFGFAGGVYDFNAGLVRFGARDYDAETGIWIEKDPVGFDSASTNLYSYSKQNPINSFDPSGFSSVNACTSQNPNGLSNFQAFSQGLQTFASGIPGAIVNIAAFYAGGAVLAGGAISTGESLTLLEGPLSGLLEGAESNTLNPYTLQQFNASSSGAEAANQAFDTFAQGLGEEVNTAANGIRSIELPGGGTASVREISSGGEPTIQINPVGGPKIKIRY